MNKQIKMFMLLLAAFVAFFGCIVPVFIFQKKFSLIPLVISAIILIISVLSPKLSSIVYKYWVILGNILGFINTRIILFFMFYLIFVPIGLIRNITSKQKANNKVDKTAKSYKINSQPTQTNSTKVQF